ncbi:MAG TPA: helix-turn-helix transcriptional regulator [Streptosporangiaceae bacterium]|nr:helix-turn-helix transcriptional regulator [Streptosporangiaceae bacterium]
MAEANPTLRRRELGVRLRELRQQASMTVEDAADRLLCSPSKISRLETGQRAASLRDVRDLCGIYGVGDSAEQERLMSLARAAKQRGWWQEYEDLGDAKRYTYIGLEDQAATISVFHSSSVPALLQTQEYARSLIRGWLPRINDSALDERVKARLMRQRRLNADQPPRFNAFLDEAALRRQVGSAAIMSAQAAKILEVAALPNVTVRVISYDAGAHPAMDSTFNFLEFHDPSIPDIVYVEGLVGNIYVERESDLARYREVLDVLTSVALPPDDSSKIIRKIGRTFGRTARKR